MFDPIQCLHEIVSDLKATTKRKEKEESFTKHWATAKRLGYDHELRKWLDLMLNQSITFGVNQIPECGSSDKGNTNAPEAEELLLQLSSREVTGGAAQSAMIKLFTGSPKKTKEVFTWVVQKDPKCGFTVKSFNKILKDNPIQTFENHKAESLLIQNEEGVTFIHWDKIPVLPEYIIEIKYDGRRSYLISEEGKDPYFVSAIGNYLPSMDSLAKEIVRECGEFVGVMDGELFLKDIKSTQSVCAKKDDQGLDTGIKFYVIGAMSLDLWKESFKRPLKELTLGQFRANAAQVVPPQPTPFVQMTEGVKVLHEHRHTLSVLNEGYFDQGYEGSVVKDPNAPVTRHKTSRKGMWKAKFVDTYDAVIVDFAEGTGKWEGMLASFIVDYQGVLSEVSGSINNSLVDEKRKEYWDRRSELVDKWIRVQSYGVTPDGRFRHAGFIDFHEGKNE